MPRPKLDSLSISLAEPADAPAIVMLRAAVAEHLTRQHGRGHWSSCPTETSVLRGLKTSRVLVARQEDWLVGTVRLTTKKPWAIDLAYFTAVPHAVYLHDLAVAPEAQRHGIRHRLMEEAKSHARAWPSHSIRLDAYDHTAGAGRFTDTAAFARSAGQSIEMFRSCTSSSPFDGGRAGLSRLSA